MFLVLYFRGTSSTWFLYTHVLNLYRMSIPNTLGVYRRSFSLSSPLRFGGIQTTSKPPHLTVYSSSFDLKVKVTSRFIILFLNSPPNPIDSCLEKGRAEQSMFIIVASLSVIAEWVAPVSTKKSTILLILYALISKRTGIFGFLFMTYPLNLNVYTSIRTFKRTLQLVLIVHTQLKFYSGHVF